MKISYNWLKELTNINITPEDLVDKLTFSGIEVESVTKTGELLENIIIAEVVTKEKHPEADKLSLCTVFDGKETHQVVCGAPNVDKGQKIAFAPIGTQFPDLKIKKVKIRGIESNGMICSEKELGLSDEHDGILVLAPDVKVGERIASINDYADTIYDVEITPNRPDLLGMIGIARDLCTGDFQSPPSRTGDFQSPHLNNDDWKSSVQIHDPTLCTRYIATEIKGVKISSSPQWLINKLNIAGIKPINNVVDVTNYVMYLHGHPLHAFDKKSLSGNKIIVRKSSPKEIFPALDNNTYELTGNELVIADEEKPIALAGIIGGKNSHITEETTDIILEAACFDRSIVRRTVYNYKINTDSGYRFERGMVEKTCEIITTEAVKLILELAGGDVVGSLDQYPNPKEKRVIALRPDRARKLLAIDISDEEIINYLEGIGIHKCTNGVPPFNDDVNGETPSTVTANSVRHINGETPSVQFEIPENRIDLIKEIDLIEEIIRLHGFDKVIETIEQPDIMDVNSFYTKRGIKNVLVNNGFYEAINISFADPAHLDMLNLSDDDYRRKVVRIKNPQGESSSIMRSTLIPGLLKNVLLNMNYGVESIKLFEMNKVFTCTNGETPSSVTANSVRHFESETPLKRLEKQRLTGIMAGKNNQMYWKEKLQNVSFFDVRGIDNTIFSYVGIKNIELRPSSEPFYLPNAGFAIYQKKNFMGTMGRLDPKVLEKFGIDTEVYMFDFDVDMIMYLANFNLSKYKEIPKFPTVYRDLSFVISEDFQINDVIKTITQVNSNIIQKVTPFDQFKGKQIPEGFRSLSLNIELVSEINTLTDEQIKKIMASIIEKLIEKFKIEMR